MAVERQETEHRQLLSDANFEDSFVEYDRNPSYSTTDSRSHLDEHGQISSWLITFALSVTLAGFVVQTEANAYYEGVLGWSKPCSSFYIAHSSLVLPWLIQMIYLRSKQHDRSYSVWLREYVDDLSVSIAAIEAFSTVKTPPLFRRFGLNGGPLTSFLGAMAIVTVALTVSGASWFSAIIWTTPGDLTAIYNCSAFFAAAFSVPLLKQSIGWASIIAVVLSIFGTFVIAYGDSAAPDAADDGTTGPQLGTSRVLGNLIALFGAVGFGLYEVLLKKWACSPRAQDPQSSMTLTLAASAVLGFYTLFTGWIAVLVLHILDIEPFELPDLEVSVYLAISVITGSAQTAPAPMIDRLMERLVSLTSLAVLVTWTNPVFGSVTSVLCVFFVAIADWLLFGLAPSLATYAGGALIMVAFGLLARDELTKHGNH